MRTVCSLISPVVAFMKRARTKIGAEKVMSFSLHSSTENLGGGRRSESDASNSSSRRSWPVKSSMGLMSANVSASPLSRNHSNEARWMEIRSGRGRTWSRLAKEKRSRATERGKATPQGANDGAGARAVKPAESKGLTRTGTATRQFTPEETRGQGPRIGLRRG